MTNRTIALLLIFISVPVVFVEEMLTGWLLFPFGRLGSPSSSSPSTFGASPRQERTGGPNDHLSRPRCWSWGDPFRSIYLLPVSVFVVLVLAMLAAPIDDATREVGGKGFIDQVFVLALVALSGQLLRRLRKYYAEQVRERGVRCGCGGREGEASFIHSFIHSFNRSFYGLQEAIISDVLPYAPRSALLRRASSDAVPLYRKEIPFAVVIFIDVVNFTHISASCPSDKVFHMLHSLFTLFDDAVEDCPGAEKLEVSAAPRGTTTVKMDPQNHKTQPEHLCFRLLMHFSKYFVITRLP